MCEAAKKEEVFSLRDFDQLVDMPIYERAAIFTDYLLSQLRKGLTIYRVVTSPVGNRVNIKDHVTGSIKEVVMFGSNNYLGLANHPEIKDRMNDYVAKCGFGLGGPPLLNGTTFLHKELEKRLSNFKATEAAMLFTSGFSVNSGIIPALVGRKDALITDRLSHASIINGSQLAKGTVYQFNHNDMDDLEKSLKTAEKSGAVNKFVVVESVYSMDGDISPLDKIHELTKSYGGFLIVDDAHGTGVIGNNGKGAAELFDLEGKIDLVMGTFSKAFGSSGGFLCGKRSIIEFLRFFSRTYFFSAAAPPVLIAQIMAAFDIMEAHPELRTSLLNNVDYIVKGLHDVGLDVKTESAIIPVLLPEGINIRKLARQIEDKGIFVNHIEYPAVPLDKQRFRISVMATHTIPDMDLLIDTFASVYRNAGLIEA